MPDYFTRIGDAMNEFLGGRVLVKTGDITSEKADAIVNAANSGLMGGGGVDGAIHRAGGQKILEECMALRKGKYPDGLPVGQAVATTAGNLPARFVIHTVGPVWYGGTHGEEKYLADCYWNSLREAVDHGCCTVAFPAVSTGVYHFPKIKAAAIASSTVKDFIENNASIQKVIFVFFSAEDEKLFLEHAFKG